MNESERAVDLLFKAGEENHFDRAQISSRDSVSVTAFDAMIVLPGWPDVEDSSEPAFGSFQVSAVK
ncbi:MAG: hypothetical protein AAGI08_02915 [Bacteroidota bacterium]